MEGSKKCHDIVSFKVEQNYWGGGKGDPACAQIVSVD